MKRKKLKRKYKILLIKVIGKVNELLEIFERKYIMKLIKETAIKAGWPPGTKIYEEGLAVLKAESGLNPRAVNYNYDKHGSMDYGICQFNDYWYWDREQIISPEDAMKPEKALPVFWEYFPKRKNDWVTYKTGKYSMFMSA